jgi:NAD-dependent dihydropyrimidine dehydrogenase PreA subunit
MRIDDSSIYVDRHKCIACGICVDRCIMDNLRLSVAPCRQACPVGMNCQGYVRLIAMGKEELAIDQLQTFGPFVPLIAATCTAPCERACARRKKDGAVHILELKRYLSKKHSKELYNIQVVAVRSKKSVAVIGADVAGLASGFKAIKRGYSVTIYAKSSDKKNMDEVLKNIVTSLEAAGAVFRYDVALEEPIRDLHLFDAIILSRLEDHSFVNTDLLLKNADFEIDSSTHLVKGNIFCCNTDSSKKKEPVFEIAIAFETIESVSRYLNGEPLDWGRGFYTQGGAVKAYKIDQRVGSEEQRALQEDLADGFDSETAKKQALRCFGCGRAFEKNQTCWYCLPCELECPHGALEVKIPYLVR